MSPTIKDVARLAGISYTTVSHVVNGTRSVRPETRQRVEQAMRDSSYVPSAVARSLRMARSGLVGMVVPDISDAFSSELAKGADDLAHDADLALLLCDLGDDAQWQQNKLHRLLAQRVDGMIAVAGLYESLPLSDLLAQRRMSWALPLVTIDHEYPGVQADVLMTDQQDMARQAVDHLLQLGHRRVLCVPGPASSQLVQARVQGWRKAMAQASCQADETSVFYAEFSVEAGYRTVMQLMRAESSREATALIVSTYAVAAGAVRALLELGLPMPQHFSLVVMDGGPLAPYSLPSLTSVDRDVRALGRLAMQRLLERIQTPGVPSQRHKVRAQLVVRESSGSAPH